MIALHFFFGHRHDAIGFLFTLGHQPSCLVECENTYGHCYDVVVSKPEPESPEELESLGLEEYEKADAYKTFIGHETSKNPLDIMGIKQVLIIQKA